MYNLIIKYITRVMQLELSKNKYFKRESIRIQLRTMKKVQRAKDRAIINITLNKE